MVPVLMLFMAALVAADETLTEISAPADSASFSVVHCDSYTVCPDRTTCCRSPYGHWFCCPYSMGQCCRDGVHCCQHGYHCDSTSTHCLRGWMKLPSSVQPASRAFKKTEFVVMDEPLEKQNQIVQCDDGNVYCPADKFCCKSRDDQWRCCIGSVMYQDQESNL